eukprot:3181838-Pyramimonas_sp.AAC.1
MSASGSGRLRARPLAGPLAAARGDSVTAGTQFFIPDLFLTVTGPENSLPRHPTLRKIRAAAKT